MSRLPAFTTVACQIVILLLVTVAANAQDEPAVPMLSADQIEQLNQGEILVDAIVTEIPVGDVIGVINATPEEVMDVVRRFDEWDQFMEDVELSELQGQDENGLWLCHGITDTPWPMENREWVIRASDERVQVDGMDVNLSVFEYVQGSGNLVDVQGYWLLLPWGDDGSQSLVRYHVAIDLGTWLPDFLLEWSTENFLPMKIQGLRDALGV